MSVNEMDLYFESKYSKLYNGDCIDVMRKNG